VEGGTPEETCHYFACRAIVFRSTRWPMGRSCTCARACFFFGHLKQHHTGLSRGGRNAEGGPTDHCYYLKTAQQNAVRRLFLKFVNEGLGLTLGPLSLFIPQWRTRIFMRAFGKDVGKPCACNDRKQGQSSRRPLESDLQS